MKLKFCCACGSTDHLEHHHLVPRSDGGSDDDSNLLTLCSQCHGKVHGMVRKNIKILTEDGLKRAKARGVKLGCPNPSAGGISAAAVLAAGADKYAFEVMPHIKEIQASGMSTLRDIAAALERRGVKTRTGGSKWHASQVSNLLKRSV